MLSQEPGFGLCLSSGCASGMPKNASNGTERGAGCPGPYFFCTFFRACCLHFVRLLKLNRDGLIPAALLGFSQPAAVPPPCNVAFGVIPLVSHGLRSPRAAPGGTQPMGTALTLVPPKSPKLLVRVKRCLRICCICFQAGSPLYFFFLSYPYIFNCSRSLR